MERQLLLLMIRLVILGFLISSIGCAANKCGSRGCINIASPHFGGGDYAYPLDSVFLVKINHGKDGCLNYPKAVCRDELDSLFGAAAIAEYRDESEILRRDTIWVFIAKTFEGNRKEIVYHSSTMPSEWELKGEWSLEEKDICRFTGMDSTSRRNTLISVACRIFPPWIMMARTAPP